jgi:hypothetical protein
MASSTCCPQRGGFEFGVDEDDDDHDSISPSSPFGDSSLNYTLNVGGIRLTCRPTAATFGDCESAYDIWLLLLVIGLARITK